MTAEDEWSWSTTTDPTRRSITTKNLTGPDIEILDSDPSKFEIGGDDTKDAINTKTAEKYSCCATSPKAITRKYSPNIQRSIPLNVILSGFFDQFVYPNKFTSNISEKYGQVSKKTETKLVL